MIKYITKEQTKNNPNFIVPIAFNEVFREIFCNPNNIVFTENLISSLLNISYKNIKGKVIYKTINSI